MNHFFIGILLAFCSFQLLGQNDEQVSTLDKKAEWHLAKDQGGVKVYTRLIEGASIKEFKATTTVKSPMYKLVNLIDKVADYPDWQANIVSAKVIKQVNENEFYAHYTTDVPWPLTDRDLVVYSKKTIDSTGVVTYEIKGAPHFITTKTGFVRIKDSKGKWQFTPMKNGEIAVLHQFVGDPGGSIPDWLVNMFVVSGPHKTLMNLKSKVNPK